MEQELKVELCVNCNTPLAMHPVIFGCDEAEGWFCRDCWKIAGPVCEEQHGEGCQTTAFQCAMDGAK